MDGLTSRVVCVAGKNQIAIDCTEDLLSRGLVTVDRLVACFNATDDGRDSFQPSYRRYCGERRIAEARLADLQHIADLILVSLEFDKIIPVPRFQSSNLFNIHFSLLPKYKGVYTSAWPILNGESHTGVTLHRIDAGIDTGDIIDQTRFGIGSDDTARDLYLKYLAHGTDLVRKNFEALLSMTFEARPQPASGSSYYGKGSINYADLQVDLKKTAYEIRNQIRAYAFREYQLPTVHGAAIVSATILETRSGGRPGTILRQDESSIDICTIDYDLRLIRDPAQGSRSIDVLTRE